MEQRRKEKWKVSCMSVIRTPCCIKFVEVALDIDFGSESVHTTLLRDTARQAFPH
jgi:hypothetical protein